MKKISIAVLGMMMAGSTFAANTAFNPGTATDVAPASSTYDYTTTTGNFVVNPFSFTISANVVVDAAESPSAMAVGAAAAKGRNVFTGHSNGGSVSQCDAPVVPTSSDDPTQHVTERLEIDNVDGCSDKPAIEDAPVAPAPTPTP